MKKIINLWSFKPFTAGFIEDRAMTLIEKIKSTQERACGFWGLKKTEFPVKCLNTSYDTYGRWMSGKNKPPGSVLPALILINEAINRGCPANYIKSASEIIWEAEQS